MLWLTWKNYIYGSILTAEIYFIKYRHCSVLFILKKIMRILETCRKELLQLFKSWRKDLTNRLKGISIAYKKKKKKRLKGDLIIVSKYLPREKMLSFNGFFNLLEKDVINPLNIYDNHFTHQWNTDTSEWKYGS